MFSKYLALEKWIISPFKYWNVCPAVPTFWERNMFHHDQLALQCWVMMNKQNMAYTNLIVDHTKRSQIVGNMADVQISITLAANPSYGPINRQCHILLK